MIPYSYNMVDMGGIDLAEANGTVVPGVYEKIVEAMNLCGDLILYNWKFAEIDIVPAAYSVLQQAHSLLINGLIQVTELDVVTVIGLPPPLVPVSPLGVTENGTYEAEPPASGFNPVVVNVPIPEVTYAFIVVIYPEGAICTASNGSVLITAPDTSGYAVFAIPSAGTWTISAVKDGNSTAEQVIISTYGTSVNISLTIIPSEYARVQYLESSGTQYINTRLPMRNDVKIILVEQGLNASNSLHGVYTNASTGLQIGCLNSQATIGFGTAVSIGVAYDMSQSHEFIIDALAGLVSFDGNVYSKAYTSGQSGNIVLFRVYAQDRNTIDKHQARCYKYEYYSNGSHEMSLVPCYRKADNKPGMYDLINDAFYTNDGTGEFTLGPEIE